MSSLARVRTVFSFCNHLTESRTIKPSFTIFSRYACTPPGESGDQSIGLPNVRNPHENPLASLAVEELRQDKHWGKHQPLNTERVYNKIVDENGFAHAIGRRKRSKARVTLGHGTGQILINGASWADYFNRLDHRDSILRPLNVLHIIDAVDIKCEVSGGGVTGQAEAIRLGIARALQNWDPTTRPALKKDGLLTRDSRVVESKKAGKKKARKSFQWVKR